MAVVRVVDKEKSGRAVPTPSTYKFKIDASLRDIEIRTVHHYWDVVINDLILITALSDSGAATTCLSRSAAEMAGLDVIHYTEEEKR